MLTRFGKNFAQSMPMTFFSLVPEMPQDVTLSEHAVISVFVTWKPPKGHVDHYKVRQASCCPHQQLKAVHLLQTNVHTFIN